MRRCVALLALAAACEEHPGLERGPGAVDVGALRKGFWLGTGTAAHQIEGGNDNDWTRWESTLLPDGGFHIANGDRSGLADNSWELFDEDLRLMRRLGSNAYRYSVEWSRLEPTRGAWNAAAAARYRQWAEALRANGIEPVVTLFHFTLPTWVADQGGFESQQTLADFEAFVRRVAKELGPSVDTWCTVNEPNVYALSAYVKGSFPPGKSDIAIAGEVFANELEAHAIAARALRETDAWDADGDGRATFIGLAHHVRVFQPATASTLDTTLAAMSDDFFNESIPRALLTGQVRLYVPLSVDITRDVDGMKGSADWLGVNYYSRDYVRADLADETLIRQYIPEGRPRTDRNGLDTGDEIFPDGLYLFLKRFAAVGVPLMVTENGLADIYDTKKCDYLARHLGAVARAARAGVDVRGYLWWSLIDNFEWESGYVPKFGLYSVSFANPDAGFPRSPTTGVECFADLARQLGHEPLP